MEIVIDFGDIKDWDAFHQVFAEIMGFPYFYGKNNNAWIDCMSCIDDEEAGMSKVTVKPGENLNIVVRGTEKAVESIPEVFTGFIEIVADVNQRFVESNAKTRLKVIAI